MPKQNKGVSLQQEVLAVGKWNGIEFTLDDLHLIADAFAQLASVHKVPLKMGHNDEQPLTDGQPALGWVTDLAVMGNKLVATFDHVPQVVHDAITAKLYRTVSVELLKNVSHKGSKYSWVLDGVALLGADIPAVNTLNDLGQYLPSKEDARLRASGRVMCSSVRGTVNATTEDDTMSEELKKEIQGLKTEFSTLRTENQKLTAANAELTAKLSAKEKEDKDRQTNDAKVKLEADRASIKTDAEKLVTEKKLTPAQRDEVLELLKDEAHGVQMARSMLKVLEKAVPASFNRGSSATSKSPDDKSNADKSPDEVILMETESLRAENPKLSFTAAKHLAMRKHPEVAKAYIHLTDGGA